MSECETRPSQNLFAYETRPSRLKKRFQDRSQVLQDWFYISEETEVSLTAVCVLAAVPVLLSSRQGAAQGTFPPTWHEMSAQ